MVCLYHTCTYVCNPSFSHIRAHGVGSPIEVKQLSMESYADVTDVQDRLIAVLMEVVGVFLWTSVMEGTHRKVGEVPFSCCVQ